MGFRVGVGVLGFGVRSLQLGVSGLGLGVGGSGWSLGSGIRGLWCGLWVTLSLEV